MDKKKLQLGMNPSTASGRLVKDILFSFIKDRPCCKCGQPMTRETFSIEHLVPWLDSNDPVKTYFDLDNIDFSHLKCNVSDARRGNQKYFTEQERKEADARIQRELWNKLSKEDQQRLRREKYLKYGK